MWKLLSKTKTIKHDLLRFKDESLSGLSIVLLIVLDIFIFTNVMMGVRGETAKVPKLSTHYPYACVKHFNKIQEEYSAFSHYVKGYSRIALLHPQVSPKCQDLELKIKTLTDTTEFKNNTKLIRNLKDKTEQNDRRLEQISKQYNTRLFERIAQMQNNDELINAKQEYDALVLDNNYLKKELSLVPKVSSLKGFDAYVSFVKKSKSSFFEAKKSYAFWQPFREYGHMLIFILPLLLFFMYFYRRNKNRELKGVHYNPVVKIISAHISLILSLPLIWFSLTLVYHALPKTLLKKTIAYLVEIGLLSLLNYVAIFLVVLLFGGLIYWIQTRTAKKKQERVYKKDYQKLVSWSQCFSCERKIDYIKPFCPFCG